MPSFFGGDADGEVEKVGTEDDAEVAPLLAREEDSISIIGFTVDIMAGSLESSSGFDKREERTSGVAEVGVAVSLGVSSCF